MQEQKGARALRHAMSIFLSQTKRGTMQVIYTRWLRFASHRQSVRQKRSASVSVVLRTNMIAVMGTRFSAWQRFARLRHSQRTRLSAADVCLSNTLNGVLRCFYFRLFRFAAFRRESRRQRQTLETVFGQSALGLRAIAFRRLRFFAQAKRQLRGRRSRSVALLCHSSSQACRRYCVRAWQAWLVKRRSQRVLGQCVSSLLKASDRGTMLLNWRRWSQYLSRQRRQASRLRVAASVGALTASGLRRLSYGRWRSFVTARTASRRRSRLALSLSSRVVRDRMHRLFWQWSSVTARRRMAFHSRRNSIFLCFTRVQGLSMVSDRARATIARRFFELWQRQVVVPRQEFQPVVAALMDARVDSDRTASVAQRDAAMLSEACHDVICVTCPHLPFDAAGRSAAQLADLARKIARDASDQGRLSTAKLRRCLGMLRALQPEMKAFRSAVAAELHQVAGCFPDAQRLVLHASGRDGVDREAQLVQIRRLEQALRQAKADVDILHRGAMAYDAEHRERLGARSSIRSLTERNAVLAQQLEDAERRVEQLQNDLRTLNLSLEEERTRNESLASLAAQLQEAAAGQRRSTSALERELRSNREHLALIYGPSGVLGGNSGSLPESRTS